MSGALDPIQEDLPLGLPSGSSPTSPDTPTIRPAHPDPEPPPGEWLAEALRSRKP